MKDATYTIAALERILNEQGFTPKEQLTLAARLVGIKLLEMESDQVTLNMNGRFEVSAQITTL